jgi:Protein of unknown function (DUF3631)/RepB DNA-primase from phage plasmid
MVVETSPGHYHRYWLVQGDWPADDQGRKDFASVMARMVASYGSDKSAKDISRVLRVPGFLHRKNPNAPHMVAVVGGNGLRYTRAEILAAFPPPEKKERPAGRVGNGGAGESHAELVRQVLTRQSYHGALASLAWRFIGAGTPGGQVVEYLRGTMLTVPDMQRDQRWQARYDEIPRLVSTAEAKRVTAQKSQPTEEIDGAALLDRVHTFLGRFVAYPSKHAQDAHTLWIAHTHAMDAWESTPRIAFLSPEPASGKTRALEVSEPLVPCPVEAVNVSPAYLFRKVADEEGLPTILFDEIDTVFGPKAKENEEIRGLLNAGHRKGAVAGRCVVAGNQVKTEEIPAYCAVAIAGLGGLPDTILSRSIVIRMRRRAPDEEVEALRRRIHAPEGEKIRDQLALWAESALGDAINEWPEMPDGVTDRDADMWEGLLVVADAAGGTWPDRSRVAAVALVTEAKDSSPSLGVRLLSDLRDVFGNNERLATDAILNQLHKVEEAPWGEIRGKPLSDIGLARRLKDYGIKPKLPRIARDVVRGYERQDFRDAWLRYLPPLPAKPVTPVTPITEDQR